MATKRNDDEQMDDATLERVIALLEPTDPLVKAITKKEACSILRMTYNTTRLAKILEEYKAKKIREAAFRAAKRGKPASMDEIRYSIEEYLRGEPVDAIAKSQYRSTSFINRILEDNAVPTRARSLDYFRPELIPDAAVRDSFAIGEIVYSARYDSTARIETEQAHRSGELVYRIWLLSEKWKQYALQPASELASLEHLVKLGVKL